MKQQFKDLVVYEIYPTSFKDSNHDGIGDLKGITEKLDYVKEMGFNAVWLNPVYKSPFKDGGYDVENFFEIDEKFGTLDDFKDLIQKAHAMEIKIFMDLVAGHASFMNKDFLKSAEALRNDKSDLFIWTDSVWELPKNYRLISGMHDRFGCYLVNFFAHQPAFNYGFKKIEYPQWQMSYKDERTFAARNYMLDVMRYWLSLGADGFRVDMADSLVKNDEDKSATIEVWNWMFERIRQEYPNAFFVSEWSNPQRALKAGFDADFVLDHWDNFYHRFFRSNLNTRGESIFHGGGDVPFALKDMKERFNEAEKQEGSLALISGNHDSDRIASSLDHDLLKVFYLMLFTLPGIPFVLYGDELEMKTSPITSKDGGYQRTGTRIPMIWKEEGKNHGFTDEDMTPYLPFYEENRISAEKAQEDGDSLYHFIKNLIKLRKEIEDLKDAKVDIQEKDRVFTFNRGSYVLIVNLSDQPIELDHKIIISSRKNVSDILPPYSGALIHE